eukprot:TRINITY_DN13059_c0_g1_i1.p1 TRINITY_DN13059_c0_g1~~TRINITY_DN13059_c0_g1_i1.p1  ORF type:complete len:192 (+),score=27.67 TRINITY_DN13059_c0_g1_i1:40-576(+)
MPSLQRPRAPGSESQKLLWDISKLRHIEVYFELSERFHMKEVTVSFLDTLDPNGACGILDMVPSHNRAAFKSWLLDSGNALINCETDFVEGSPLMACIPGTGFFKANTVSALDAGDLRSGDAEAEADSAAVEENLHMRIRLSDLVPVTPKPKKTKSSSGRLQTGLMLDCIDESTSLTS